MRSPDDILLTRDVAAHAAGVKPSTITMWVSRGWTDPATGEHHKLEIARRDWRGRALFRHRDILLAEQATRRRGRKRNQQHWATLNTNSTGLRHVR